MPEDKDSKKGDKPKKKVNRKKGGFALVEVREGEGGVGRVLEIITSDLDGQKEATDDLKVKIEDGTIPADGKRTFGIVQIKTLDICPKVETKVKVTF